MKRQTFVYKFNFHYIHFFSAYIFYWHERSMEYTFIYINIFCVLLIISLVHSPPRIIKQPPTDELLYQVAQQSNENDKPFLIECEAEGEPAPKYVLECFFLSPLFLVNICFDCSKPVFHDPFFFVSRMSFWKVCVCVWKFWFVEWNIQNHNVKSGCLYYVHERGKKNKQSRFIRIMFVLFWAQRGLVR